MKVLVATEKPFAAVAVNGIKEVLDNAGVEMVLLEKYPDKAALLKAVEDVEGLIVRSDIVDAEVFDAAPKLKIVVRAGAGYDNIDLTEIITAVIGVETIYGKSTGNVKTLDALATLSFDYTRRAAFFQNELASFLAICHKNKTDPTTVRGSFAGALGICQFMPSNIEKLGIDMDGDGKVDLTASTADAVASGGATTLKAWDGTTGCP